MNEKASAISLFYVKQFRLGFNQYVQLQDQRPYETLERYRAMMWRLGMLVEIWACVEGKQKELNHG